MIRWVSPSNSLEVSKYIDAYLYLERPAELKNTVRPKLSPHPAAHLIFSAPNEVHHYETKDNSYVVSGSHWVYPHSQTLELDHAKYFSCLGVKFKVGALYSLKEIGFSQIVLNTVEGLDFDSYDWCSVNSVLELLSQVKLGADQCVMSLDEFFLRFLSNCHEDKHSEITRRAIPMLSHVSVSELSENLFCSQRTLERSFSKVTGLTLKQCQSMLKLDVILEHLYQREQSEINWVDLAFQFGFSDQPHFIRYLKQHINLTPRSYVQERGFTIDVYGGVEGQ